MVSPDIKECMSRGKGFPGRSLRIALTLTILGMSSGARAEATLPLQVMLDRGPVTLNPRRASDAMGQRLGALIFSALTRIDKDLEPQPDLSSGWQISDGGKSWRFEIRPGLTDHEGAPITAEKITQCLENYRVGKPLSYLKAAFPHWRATTTQGSAVLVQLDQPSPYLARNLSGLRYFRTAGSLTPCTEPETGQKIITSGMYRPDHWVSAPESKLLLLPVALPGQAARRALDIQFVTDDNARAIKLLRGEVDVTQYSLSLTKIRWFQKNQADRFEVLEREAVPVSYLQFNFRDPILARREVRRAISEAIDRESMVKHKLMGFCSIAGSLLSPLLPESAQQPFRYDPAHAELLLDQAGFPRPKPGGVRLTLHYRTTPVRDGIETALVFQDMLARVGIQLVIDAVEPAVFLASVKKGAFQLYSSRWIGISDASILYKTLRSGQPDNRGAYHNPEMDLLLDRASTEVELSRRLPDLKRVQELVAQDLPFFPLWYWNNGVVLRKGLTGLKSSDLSLSGAYEPLTRLK
jgi:peptide/nickel transport system substrate-binding protein